MNQLKRFLGILWMMIGPIVFILLIISALQNINSTGKGDISNPIPWIIILVIFAPIAIGLLLMSYLASTIHQEN
jgi:uncharacterized membrane protein YadS